MIPKDESCTIELSGGRLHLFEQVVSAEFSCLILGVKECNNAQARELPPGSSNWYRGYNYFLTVAAIAAAPVTVY
jgi:hypothetical protein